MENVQMRTGADRLRHTILFEMTGLMLCIPVVMQVFDKPLSHTAGFSAFMSFSAMVWNLCYNYIFDVALIKLKKPLYPRPVTLRIFHAFLFEASFIVLTLPVVMNFLNVGVVGAVMTDIGFSAFFMVTAFIFNWVYDIVFPVPSCQTK